VESNGAVVLEVLTGVKDVETADPEGDRGSEDDDAWVERAGDGDPCGGGSDAEGKAENDVRPAGEALHVAVREEDEENDGRKKEREAIELGGGEEKDECGEDSET
jgi:hypothetical protein